MKRKIWEFFTALAVFALFFALIIIYSPLNENSCYEKKTFYQTTYYGTVINKYIDYKNHGTPWITIQNRATLDSEKIDFHWDSNDNFNIIKIGDTLSKRFDTDTMIIRRANQVLILKVDIPCSQ